ncbi:poly(A)-specific ribonuclease PARN-like [Anticarsia gemmatalis]|uniref:poly(A)-specific ribonuclease PARN-like n=1 Tax=Anticarsia gemmatalis TaxID=129554 RepID=UPI003F76E0BD
MEVVRKNFKEALPLVKESIDKADFLAIDAEFTGLINGRDVSVFDLPEDCYIRSLAGCSEFLLIQFGLCAFYWDEKRNHYMNDAYNFYLFPRGRPGPERMFMCQSSSLDFLASNGFDFNKLIKEGISYMTEPTETRLRETLTEKQQNYSKEKELRKIPDENKEQIEEICERVKNFVKDAEGDKDMEITGVNAFIRMLLFQELNLRFKEHVFVDTKILENKTRVLKVTRKDPKNDIDQIAARKQREWDELEDAVGFSKVARMISQSEKLVVGHNMLLDVIHTLNHFFQPLPSDYASFKEFAHCMFPKLLDTKYMSSLPPFKDKLNSNVLPELLATLIEPPFSMPKVGSLEGRGYRRREDKCHEAGYDAYMTGLCALAMAAHLLRLRGDPGPRLAPASPALAAVLKPFLNKVFLARTARLDSPYINICGPDPSPPRDHVFHLTFPREWLRSDINQLFSPFGAVIVQFLDDTHALVALDRREQAAGVARALSRHPRVQLASFASYRTWRDQREKTPSRSESRSEPYRLTNSGDARVQQWHTMVSSNTSSPRASPQLPVKVSRARSSSTSMAAPAQSSPPARKRTSSGVFQVDESEPVPKKAELTRSLSDSPRKKPDIVANGCQKTTDKEKNKEKERKEQKKPKIVEKFDSEAKSNCVSAFKESDSWD